MDQIGLTFEEFAEFKVKPRVGADAAFQRAAEMELEGMFKAASALSGESTRLSEASRLLIAIADQEEIAWARLQTMT